MLWKLEFSRKSDGATGHSFAKADTREEAVSLFMARFFKMFPGDKVRLDRIETRTKVEGADYEMRIVWDRNKIAAN